MAAAATVVTPATPRNLALEARLVAQPDDEATIAVYADWLQSVGDPWGDLIALELAERDAEARAVLREHLNELIGDLEPRFFEWRRGFIHKLNLGLAHIETVAALLAKVFDLRTAMILRELHSPLRLRPNAIDVLNARGRSVRSIYTRFTDDITKLEMPSLQQLSLQLATEQPSPATMAALPPVKWLRIAGPLPLPALSALLDSPLIADLCWLELVDIDRSGEALIARRRAELAHIPVLNFSLALDDLFPQQKAAWRARQADEFPT